MRARLLSFLRPRLSLAGLSAMLVCAAGVYIVGRSLNDAYPIADWLVWELAPIWGYALLWNVACVSFGAWLLRALLGERPLPAPERLLQSMMLGLTGLVLLLYVLGFCRLFKPAVAVALPLAALALSFNEGRALFRELCAWRASISPPSSVHRLLGGLAALGGAAALCFLYLEALTPSAINYDATWYHFPIAQDYARLGRIVPFPGENHRAFPHLTSMLHTWSLLVPLPRLQHHWMLSLHLEFAIVVWRLFGAATLARWLLGGRDVRGLWAGFFLFPSIFIYDQSIGGSADHFLGFFAVPVALAAFRALKRFDVRWCVLLGVALGGHVLVKYQGIYLFAAIAVAVLGRLLFLAGKLWLSRQRVLPTAELSAGALGKGVAALALTFLLVSSAHFAKNAVFYHNPFYPFAQKVFTSSTPKKLPGFYAEAPHREVFEPKGKGLSRQVWALKKLYTYSLETANRNLTKRRPYMGSLFSMLLPCALFVRGRRRFFGVAGLVVVAFLVWANSAPNDRYLLSFYDLCIGLALALVVKVWELGWAARLGLVPLVALQLVWGGDAMLYYGRKQLNAALDLIGNGYDRGADGRLASNGTQRDITRATPKDAVILSRNYKGLLGLDRTVLSDIRSAQDYISYSHLKDTRDFYELVQSRGVTHLMYPKGQRRPERWNNTVLFTDLFVRYGVGARRIGKISLAELPKEPPPKAVPFLVLSVGIRGVKDGIYGVEQLDFDPRSPERFTPRPRPRHSLSEARSHLPNIRALLIGKRKSRALTDVELSQFHSVESWDGDELWLRRR